MCTSLTLQSFYFISQMVGIIKKKLHKAKEMNDKKVEFMWLEENPSELSKLSFYKKKEATNIFWPNLSFGFKMLFVYFIYQMKWQN